MRRQSKYKVLAIDVDGTLLFGRESISAANKEALLAVKEHGMVCLCTGRSPRESEWIIEELGLHESFHVLGGGALLKQPGGELHPLSHIEADIVSEVRNKLTEHQLFFLSQGRWQTELPPAPHKLNSVSALAVGEDQAHQVSRQLKEICKDYYVTTVADKNNHWIQVTAPDCNKGSGIIELISRLNLELDQVLAVGDMYNDVPMFDLLPFSVAMGNAPDEVKSKASFVTRGVDDDGLAHAIWDYFFD